jgi:uncharacterized membrane protein
MQIARWLHVLAVVVWVGGMVFAHFALRPAAQQLLEPPLRLPLMAAALARFFQWVAAAVVVILASGFGWIALAGGFGRVGAYVHTMTLIGLVAARAFPAAAVALQTIRRLVVVNLALGVLTITVAMLGKGL